MDQFSAHLDRAWDLVAKGDTRGALSSAEQARALDPKSPEVWNLLGYIAAAEGDAEEAIQHYRQAIQLDESYLEPMLNAAELLVYPLGEYEEAIGLCDEALEFAETVEETADATLLKVDAHLARGDTATATALLSILPEGPFETAQYDMLIGRAWYDLGRLDAARGHLERAIEKDPKLADALYYLGAIDDEEGRTAEAVRRFLAARAVDVQQPRAAWSLPPLEFERLLEAAVAGSPALVAALEGVDVLCADTPGVEVVADGVDPRSPLLFDGPPRTPKAPSARLFVYQRNVERLCWSVASLREELPALLEREAEAVRRPPEEPKKPRKKGA